jgi:alpha-L-fucosidase
MKIPQSLLRREAESQRLSYLRVFSLAYFRVRALLRPTGQRLIVDHVLLFAIFCLIFCSAASPQEVNPGLVNRNRSERIEWFRDAGFGLFIHWSFDSQLGPTISHSMVGASEAYLQRFINELSRSFNPKRFDPHDWAVLARLAGVKYVVFTTKHHSGFCMFRTASTPFNVMNTPFGRDATAEIVTAFREQGIAIGFYYSPDDFYWLHREGKQLDRHRPEVEPANNPELLKYDQSQIRELLTNYGPIDVLFFDGPSEGLKELAWDLQPNLVITRGVMETPEQYIPGVPLDRPWEACLTMGTSWQYKPTNEVYKSGTELIRLLIETRAKGGNLLLNVGPKPNGELPLEQEDRLREIALWNFVNRESVEEVRPWVVTNENDVWFARRKNEDTVYAFVAIQPPWKLGEWKTFTLRSVEATVNSVVSVLGQNDKVLEYRPEVIPQTKWRQTGKGLEITAMRAQRLYDDRKWPNPVVLKMTHVKPAMEPPQVITSHATWDRAAQVAILQGELKNLGKAESVELGFQYRRKKGLTDLYEKTEPWTDSALVKRNGTGSYSTRVSGLTPGEAYEFRALVKHPLITIYGESSSFEAK